MYLWRGYEKDASIFIAKNAIVKALHVCVRLSDLSAPKNFLGIITCTIWSEIICA